MTRETEVALAAIDALCGKRKAKALRKLVLKAVESERGSVWIDSVGTGGVSTTWIDSFGATTTNVPNAPITYTT